MGSNKLTQSEIDGVSYRRSKTWQIALSQLNSASAMCFYILIGYASYVANVGYGVATAMVGIILTGTRLLDGITDPIVALIIDKTNTKHGKLRIFMLTGWLIEAGAVYVMFSVLSGKGYGMITFIGMYIVYVIGYTMNNITGQIIGPVLTNDPKQRPLVYVWATIYNYLIPMTLIVIINMVILPMFGGEFNIPMLAATSILCIGVSFILEVFALIGVSGADKPESFQNISTRGEEEKIKFKDMFDLIKGNRNLQTYIVAAASDKLAQQTGSQAIVGTIIFGIIIGNMGLSSIISMAAMLPSIIFAILGARYVGKYGSRKAILRWSMASIIIAVINVAFFFSINPRDITVNMVPTVLFFILLLALNGSKMVITTASGSMMADVIDYEYSRTGKYMPAAVTATYSFIDKFISSLGATIAAGAVSLIGYKTVMPQPGDDLTNSLLIMGMVLYFGLPVFGWICSIIAMGFSTLTREVMVEVQKDVNNQKAALVEEHA